MKRKHDGRRFRFGPGRGVYQSFANNSIHGPLSLRRRIGGAPRQDGAEDQQHGNSNKVLFHGS